MTREAVLAWIETREPRPPAALAERIRGAVLAGPEHDASGDLPTTLAEVALAALERVLAQPDQGRGIATDLLAADALITYAVEAQAITAPARLGEFAARLSARMGGAA